MKLSFDLDGVLVDFESAVVKVIREMHGLALPDHYRMAQWCYAEFLKPDEWNRVFNHLMSIDQLWADLPTYQENVDALCEYCQAHGDEGVYFTTSRPPCEGGSVATMTGLWLWEHGLPQQHLTVVKDASEKKEVMIANKINWSIDDLPSTIEHCGSIELHNPRLLDRPYNRHAVNLPRVSSVAEFLMEVELCQ